VPWIGAPVWNLNLLVSSDVDRVSPATKKSARVRLSVGMRYVAISLMKSACTASARRSGSPGTESARRSNQTKRLRRVALQPRLAVLLEGGVDRGAIGRGIDDRSATARRDREGDE